MNQQEREILRALNEALEQPSTRAWIDSRLPELEKRLADNPAAALCWEALPLEIYGNGLPDFVRSSWIFILRAGGSSGTERHPNSHQRVAAYRGEGDFQVWRDGGLRSHLLVSDAGAAIEDRWESIPVNVWHRPVAPPGRGHWVVVSFHTAATDELIEERPTPADFELTEQRRYAEMKLGAR